METIYQQTIKEAVIFTGVGLHSGNKIQVSIKPAPADSGIHFKVTTPNMGIVDIPATYQFVGALTYNTTLKTYDAHVQTVEHLLSALHGYGIDNAVIELDGFEVPVMDGSAAPFIYLLSEAGIQQQKARKSFVKIATPIRVELDSAWIEASPPTSSQLIVDYSIEFNHPSIGYMRYRFDGDRRKYMDSIAPARTFGFMREVEFLLKNGLIKGASMQNAIVLDDTQIISGPLRFADEFVRHKTLDFWGDIVLLGKPLLGRIRAHRAGHKLHAMLVEKLSRTPGALQPVNLLEEKNAVHFDYSPALASQLTAF